jgi:hypothetical protein
MFRYSLLVRFPSTVGKFDASQGNHEFLFIYYVGVCQINKSRIQYDTLGSLYNVQILADLSRVPVVGTRLVVQP